MESLSEAARVRSAVALTEERVQRPAVAPCAPEWQRRKTTRIQWPVSCPLCHPEIGTGRLRAGRLRLGAGRRRQRAPGDPWAPHAGSVPTSAAAALRLLARRSHAVHWIRGGRGLARTVTEPLSTSTVSELRRPTAASGEQRSGARASAARRPWSPHRQTGRPSRHDSPAIGRQAPHRPQSKCLVRYAAGERRPLQASCVETTLRVEDNSERIGRSGTATYRPVYQ